jgi:hypothetical protein
MTTCQSCAKARLADLDVATLTALEGKTISDFCNTNYVAANINHCAHFVSHLLDLKIGMICGAMSWATRKQGVTLRVDEIYNQCAQKGLWFSKPANLLNCLAFVTPESNVNTQIMGNNPRKHIGICIGGKVWHYSNGQDKVVSDSTERFLIKFKGAYGATTQMYFGNFDEHVA